MAVSSTQKTAEEDLRAWEKLRYGWRWLACREDERGVPCGHVRQVRSWGEPPLPSHTSTLKRDPPCDIPTELWPHKHEHITLREFAVQSFTQITHFLFESHSRQKKKHTTNLRPIHTARQTPTNGHVHTALTNESQLYTCNNVNNIARQLY